MLPSLQGLSSLSTDSNLNAAATILANDIIVLLLPASPKPWLKVLRSDKGQLIIAKVGSVVLGLLALRFSLDPNSYLHPKLVPGVWVMPWVMPWSFYMPVISIPVLLTILGFCRINGFLSKFYPQRVAKNARK